LGAKEISGNQMKQRSRRHSRSSYNINRHYWWQFSNELLEKKLGENQNKKLPKKIKHKFETSSNSAC
jgi:hypothetical protein